MPKRPRIGACFETWMVVVVVVVVAAAAATAAAAAGVVVVVAVVVVVVVVVVVFSHVCILNVPQCFPQLKDCRCGDRSCHPCKSVLCKKDSQLKCMVRCEELLLIVHPPKREREWSIPDVHNVPRSLFISRCSPV